MKVTGQRVDFVLWLDKTNKLKTLSEVFHHITKDLVCFFFLFFLYGILLLGKLLNIFSTLGWSIKFWLHNKICDIRVITFQEYVLRIFFDFNDILQYTLIHCLKTISILWTFNFRSEIDLSYNQFSQELELTYHHNTWRKRCSDICHLFGQRLILFGSPRIQSLEVYTYLLIELHNLLD